MQLTQKIDVQVSSGNVFDDLDLPQPTEMLIKAELVRLINEIIAKRQLSQESTAELLASDRTQVSALHRGKLTAFTIEQLFRFLQALDRDVEILVKPKPSDRTTARIAVVDV